MDGKLRVSTSPSSSVKEKHGQVIYAIAWSEDISHEQEVDDDNDETSSSSSSEKVSPGTKRKPSSPSNCQRYYRYFASCAGRYATVYQVEIPNPQQVKPKATPSKTGPIVVHQSYVDPHPEEEFFACAFGGRSFLPSTRKESRNTKRLTIPRQQTRLSSSSSSSSSSWSSSQSTNRKRCRQSNQNRHCMVESEEEADVFEFQENELSVNLDQDPTGPQLLCLAGKNFAIKIIDTTKRQLWMTLSGHGDEVTCLKFSPMDEFMLLSASNDKSCRIWNVRNGTCVAILAGHEGHRDIVMTANWHPLGTKIVSGGHDNVVKIWDVGEGTKIHSAMKESYAAQLQRRKQHPDTVEAKDHFKPVICQFPILSTHKVHFQPVDCVEFVGDLVLSKGSNSIVLWYPDYVNRENPKVLHPAPTNLQALKTYAIKGADEGIMFYRFCTDRRGRTIAVGNMEADVLLFDINSKGNLCEKKLEASSRIMTPVRMTAFCPDGRILLCCCDDGTIAKWDVGTRG